MRRISPDKTFPGPTSQKKSAPAAAMFRTVSSQRTGLFTWAAKRPAQIARVGLRSQIGVQRDRRLAQLYVCKIFTQTVRRLCHKRRVERAADRQRDCTAAVFGYSFDECGHFVTVAGDGELAGAVVVDGIDMRKGRAQGFYLFIRQPQDGGH